MKLIGASKIITCNKNFEIIDNGGILFDEKRIIKIGDFNSMKNKKIESNFYESCVITPAFINSHIHFEFSANYTTLKYGNFSFWLDSIFKSRDGLLDSIQDSIHINNAIKESMKSGVSCVGAISSRGLDLEALSTSPLKVLFFNEAIGLKEEYLESNIRDFDNRLKKSLILRNDNFKVGIALHSPYSLHPKLVSYVLNKAKENNLLLSTHFLESKDELLWIDSSKGPLKAVLENNLNIGNIKPFYSKREFLDLFSSFESLFVHCLYLSNDDLIHLSSLKSEIISCPRSNRLLSNTYFDFFKAKDYGFNLIIATDGRSSNNSLSILDEARAALFGYRKFDISNLAKQILLSITANPAKKFRFNNGILQKNKASDFAIFKIKDIATSNQVALHTILHAKEVEDLYINGRKVDFENY